VTESVERLSWRELPLDERDALARRLIDLYGAHDDEEAFDALAVDKQQALLLLMQRMRDLSLWDSVRRVSNVYGEGGVGMNFHARRELLAELRARKDFTKRLARHRENEGGFLERGTAKASLHFLYQVRDEMLWAVHFDLYNVWSSPMGALRHLVYEKLGGRKPDWREIRAAIRPTG
jgi:hypothetical protein